MNRVLLKGTSLQVSKLCLGTVAYGNSINKEQCFELLDAFVRGGGNFIDTANVYCRWIPGLDNYSEQVLGEWMKVRGAYQDVVIATKGGHYLIDDPAKKSRVCKKEVEIDLEDSLRSLGLDAIDFYWLHRDDESKPVEEIVDMMEEFKKQGKIRYYGFSNYKTARLEQARQYMESKGITEGFAVSNQWSYASVNLEARKNADPTLVLFSEEEYAWHEKTGIPAIPYSSSAFGLFEKMRKAGIKVTDGRLIEGDLSMLPASLQENYVNEDNLRKYEYLMKLREQSGHSMQALSLYLLMRQPFTTIPVCGARTIEQLAELLEACKEEEYENL